MNLGLLGGIVVGAPEIVGVLRDIAYVWSPHDVDFRYRMLAAGLLVVIAGGNRLAGATLAGYRPRQTGAKRVGGVAAQCCPTHPVP